MTPMYTQRLSLEQKWESCINCKNPCPEHENYLCNSEKCQAKKNERRKGVIKK